MSMTPNGCAKSFDNRATEATLVVPREGNQGCPSILNYDYTREQWLQPPLQETMQKLTEYYYGAKFKDIVDKHMAELVVFG